MNEENIIKPGREISDTTDYKGFFRYLSKARLGMITLLTLGLLSIGSNPSKGEEIHVDPSINLIPYSQNEDIQDLRNLEETSEDAPYSFDGFNWDEYRFFSEPYSEKNYPDYGFSAKPYSNEDYPDFGFFNAEY